PIWIGGSLGLMAVGCVALPLLPAGAGAVRLVVATGPVAVVRFPLADPADPLAPVGVVTVVPFRAAAAVGTVSPWPPVGATPWVVATVDPQPVMTAAEASARTSRDRFMSAPALLDRYCLISGYWTIWEPRPRRKSHHG